MRHNEFEIHYDLPAELPMLPQTDGHEFTTDFNPRSTDRCVMCGKPKGIHERREDISQERSSLESEVEG